MPEDLVAAGNFQGDQPVYYSPPPDTGPNIFTAFYASYYKTRTPWANEIFEMRLRNLDPMARRAALLADSQHRLALATEIVKSGNSLEEAYVKAKADVTAAGETAQGAVISSQLGLEGKLAEVGQAPDAARAPLDHMTRSIAGVLQAGQASGMSPDAIRAQVLANVSQTLNTISQTVTQPAQRQAVANEAMKRVQEAIAGNPVAGGDAIVGDVQKALLSTIGSQAQPTDAMQVQSPSPAMGTADFDRRIAQLQGLNPLGDAGGSTRMAVSGSAIPGGPIAGAGQTPGGGLDAADAARRLFESGMAERDQAWNDPDRLGKMLDPLPDLVQKSPTQKLMEYLAALGKNNPQQADTNMDVMLAGHDANSGPGRVRDPGEQAAQKLLRGYHSRLAAGAALENAARQPPTGTTATVKAGADAEDTPDEYATLVPKPKPPAAVAAPAEPAPVQAPPRPKADKFSDDVAAYNKGATDDALMQQRVETRNPDRAASGEVDDDDLDLSALAKGGKKQGK